MCNGTKEFLSQNGFFYIDHPLEDPANRQEARRLSRGERGIPVIRFNGSVLIGFDRRRLKTLLGLD
ncbi:MAG: hypothetical protein OWQ57_10550 [Sulfobacillus sp.]|nr:hypothetical protein [Sulfobacillus sp.]